MTMAIAIRLSGFLMLALAALHPFFPARFHWKQELARLSLLNRQIFVVHTFFVVLVLVLMGALCALAPELLLARGPLARWIDAGFCVFWLARLIAQWFVYDPSLWRGRRFNTVIHWIFSLIWVYFTALFGAAFWLQTHSGGVS